MCCLYMLPQGSGVFYAGYVLFQVPSNLILSRLGARTWLPFITAAWGCVATFCIFIRGEAGQIAFQLAGKSVSTMVFGKACSNLLLLHSTCSP